MTIKLSTIDCNILSVVPPTYPEKDPKITAIDLPISTARPAIISVFLIANVNIQKTSCHKDVVPNIWSKDGASFLGTTRRFAAS